jgi:hypothetical protein
MRADAHRRSARVRPDRRRWDAGGRGGARAPRAALAVAALPAEAQRASHGGASWPYWERDQRFEIEAHVRHATLPSPGDEREFLDWISDFYPHRLDRSRPLWEMALLYGLVHGGGRWCGRPSLPGRRGRLGEQRGPTARRRARALRAVSTPRRTGVGLGRGSARMAPASTRACRPGGRRGPRGRSRRLARADASA